MRERGILSFGAVGDRCVKILNEKIDIVEGFLHLEDGAFQSEG